VNNVSINSGAIVNQVGPLTLQSTSASSATSSGTINVSQGQILNNYGTLNGTGTITLKLGLSPGTYQASAPDNTIGIYKSIQLVTSNTSTPTSYINGNGSGKLNGQTVSLDSSILNLQGGQAVLIAQNEVLSNTTLSFAQPQSNLLVAKEVTSGGSTYLMLTLNPNLVFSGPSAPYYQSFTGAYINGNLNAILAVQNHPNDLIHQVNATETVQAATSIGFNGFSPHISNLSLRLTDARDGKNGFSASNTGEGLAGPSGDEGKSGGDFLTPSPDNRWGVFLTGIGDFAKTDSADGYTGYNTTQAGFTLGADYRLTPNLIVGALAGFAHEHAGFADGSTLSIDGAKFGVYGTAFTGGFYLNAAVLGGYDTFDSHRVDIGGAIAKGSSDAEEIATFLGAGYDFTMGNFKIGPTSSFQYERSFTNGFAETGGTVPLEYPDQSTGAITTKVGSKMSYSFKVLGCQFTPELRTEWEHDFRATIPVDFAVPQGPTVQDLSPRVGLDSLSLVAGASAQVSQSVTVYLYYNGDLLRQNYTENDVSGGVRCSF